MFVSAGLQIFLAWIYGHIAEYVIHRWLLHKLGKKRSHPLSYHFHDHHRVARKNAMHDPMYTSHTFRWDARTKEIVGLATLLIIHSPFLLVFPWVFATLAAASISYYYQHAKSHKSVEWARVVLPWHYDHHMGPDQDKNWGVRTAWLDTLFRTREKYYGTRRERIEFQRRLIRTLNRQRRLR